MLLVLLTGIFPELFSIFVYIPNSWHHSLSEQVNSLSCACVFRWMWRMWRCIVWGSIIDLWYEVKYQSIVWKVQVTIISLLHSAIVGFYLNYLGAFCPLTKSLKLLHEQKSTFQISHLFFLVYCHFRWRSYSRIWYHDHLWYEVTVSKLINCVWIRSHVSNNILSEHICILNQSRKWR